MLVVVVPMVVVSVLAGSMAACVPGARRDGVETSLVLHGSTEGVRKRERHRAAGVLRIRLMRGRGPGGGQLRRSRKLAFSIRPPACGSIASRIERVLVLVLMLVLVRRVGGACAAHHSEREAIRTFFGLRKKNGVGGQVADWL